MCVLLFDQWSSMFWTLANVTLQKTAQDNGDWNDRQQQQMLIFLLNPSLFVGFTSSICDPSLLSFIFHCADPHLTTVSGQISQSKLTMEKRQRKKMWSKAFIFGVRLLVAYLTNSRWTKICVYATCLSIDNRHVWERRTLLNILLNLVCGYDYSCCIAQHQWTKRLTTVKQFRLHSCSEKLS